MMGFQQKVVPIDAFQFTGPDEQGALPDGIVTAGGGRYMYCIGGLRDIRVGQYVVRHADRLHDILTIAQFEALYEAVPEAPADELTTTEG